MRCSRLKRRCLVKSYFNFKKRMQASYTSSVNRVASFRLAWVATFPSRGRLIYTRLPTIECCKQFSSVGECLGAPEYNKKRFSSKRKSTETNKSISIPVGIVDILLKQFDMPSARYVCFANAE